MTEEVVVPVDETKVVLPEGEQQSAQAPEYSEEEQSALEQGWKPEDKFEGDKSKWVPADEFLRRGELFGKIDNLNRDLKDTRKALKALQEHHQRVQQSEYEHALQTLRNEKKAAYEAGDADAVIEADERLAAERERQQVERRIAQQAAAAPDPRFVAWANENKWYVNDPELKAFADEIGVSHARVHPDMDPADVLVYVKGRVKKAFPEKFTNPNREKPNAVEGKGTPTTHVKEYELSEEERKVMNTFIRSGIMTKEEYIKDLRKVKGE
jgi:hypothetical protein